MAMYCRQHHVTVVKELGLLLQSGAEVNAQGGYYRNALQSASYEVMVRLILKSGGRDQETMAMHCQQHHIKVINGL